MHCTSVPDGCHFAKTGAVILSEDFLAKKKSDDDTFCVKFAYSKVIFLVSFFTNNQQCGKLVMHSVVEGWSVGQRSMVRLRSP